MREPNETNYACRESTESETNAVCRIPKPRQGKWIAGVRNDAAAPGTPYRINAAIEPRRR
jgi:hypothetical protein